MYFQDLILTLQRYWNENGCLLTQPYDMEKGAGTFNPCTFLRSLGPEPFNAAYAEPCRRPTDGRYGDNPIRMQHYYQFQVILKPNPKNIVDLYLGSLDAIGIKHDEHDIRFVHDDWESPTLGAWGLGWEVWLDGMEVTQFTYFQQVGGIELDSVCGEITYGLERLCMFLQGVDNVFDLQYNEQFTYGDIFHENEVQGSRHNFELADVDMHLDLFQKFEKECIRLAEAGNPVGASDYCLKASHSFNMLDARGAISVNERQNYILKVRTLSRAVAEAWLANREELGYPLTKRLPEMPAPVINTESAEKANLADKESLLIELGVEEMPAKVFGPLEEQLPRLFDKYIASTGLEMDDVKFYVTPRRLAISVGSIATRQPDQVQEIKGPPMRVAKGADGNWTKAGEGFAKKAGVSLDDAEVREIKGTEYLFVRKEVIGRKSTDILAEAIPEFFAAIHWYKTMRWCTGKTQFVRPVQWLVALLGEAIIPCEFGGCASGDTSMGHRFLCNKEVTVAARRDAYIQALRDAYVIVDQDERKELICQKMNNELGKQNLKWREDQGLLSEVNCLVEYPVPVVAEFNPDFLEIPDSVLVSEMKEHQKYFAVLNAEGKLSNHFVAISNMVCKDMQLVADGYEKVLRSRFSDAKFFLKEDTKTTLESRLEKLEGITYQADLGTIGDKVKRIATLAAKIGEKLELGSDALSRIDHISRLCKNDLTTAMVFEFTDLQGEIGTYYAKQEGIEDTIAEGIQGHYLPKSMNDVFPTSVEAAIVGLADRLDSLVGISAVTRLPSGSADPFALRRACLTSVALIVHFGLRLDLSELLALTFDNYGEVLAGKERAELLKGIQEFYLKRIQGLLKEQVREDFPGGFSYDSIDAVAQASISWFDLTDFVDRVKAMDDFRKREDFADVAATFKRANNIIKEEIAGDIEVEKLPADEDKNLLDAVNSLEAKLTDLLVDRKYVEAMSEIGGLRQTVDTFFDSVRVNDDDEAVATNRKRLVRNVVNLVMPMADFSAIQ